MKHRARWRLFAEALDESQTAGSLHGSESIDVPLGALGLVDADEGWLAAHGQAYILRLQVCVHALRNLFNLDPCFLAEGPGRSRCVIQAANGHGVVEVHIGRLGGALDWRGF